jgi:hypothetical protein
MQALDVDWNSAKLDFIRLRSQGVKYNDSVLEICDRYGVKEGTVEYHMRKGQWVETLKASQGVVIAKIKEKVALTAELIAEEVGHTFLEGIQGLRKEKPSKLQEHYLKAQSLKTYTEIRSRFNPDGQEKSGGVSLFQVNVGDGMRQGIEQAKTAQVNDVQDVKSE